MAVPTRGEFLREGTEFESIQFESSFSNFFIGYADKDGDIEFGMEEDDERITKYLCQDDIRFLITHLQKQLR